MLTKALKEKKKKTRKQERKANRIVRLDFENSQKVEVQHWSQKLRINKITAETTKRL